METGDIENTITASGEVLPEFEEVISSPVKASVQSVLLDAGTQVKAGEPVLTLDKSASQTEYEKMKFELETKRNNISKLKLELDKSFTISSRTTTSSNCVSGAWKLTWKMQSGYTRPAEAPGKILRKQNWL